MYTDQSQKLGTMSKPVLGHVFDTALTCTHDCREPGQWPWSCTLCLRDLTPAKVNYCVILQVQAFFHKPPTKKKGSIGEVGSVSIALRYSRAWVNESLNVVQLSSVPLLLEHALQRECWLQPTLIWGRSFWSQFQGFCFS